MDSTPGFGESIKVVFYYENNGRSFEYLVSNLHLNQAFEFPRNQMVKILSPEFISSLNGKTNFLRLLNNPSLKIYSKYILVTEIPVRPSDMVLDETGVFTIDFNLTEGIKSELIDYFKNIKHSIRNIEEFIVVDVNQSDISPEYLHIDMMVKRKINPDYT